MITFLGFEKSGLLSKVPSYVEAMRDSIQETFSKESSRSKLSKGSEFESYLLQLFYLSNI